MAKRSTTSTLIATVLKLFWAVLSQSEKVPKTHCASSMQDTSSWRCLIVSCNTEEEGKKQSYGRGMLRVANLMSCFQLFLKIYGSRFYTKNLVSWLIKATFSKVSYNKDIYYLSTSTEAFIDIHILYVCILYVCVCTCNIHILHNTVCCV